MELRTEELARSNRELEEFASVVAHDLRSPLLTVSGYCQLLSEEYGDGLDANAHDYLGQIVAAAARMNRLIEDILEYSRLGRSPRPLQPVDVQSVLAQATANLEGSIREHAAGIEVGQMPTVVGNPTQLVQLFQNLIDNGIKFRREETPKVRVTASQVADGWQFAVEDNGVGIAEEYFEQILPPFAACTAVKFPERGSGWPSARKSSSGTGDGFGRSRPSAKARRFTSRSPTNRPHYRRA